MNSTLFNRFQNYLIGLASVAVVVLATAFSIELLYRLFQFIETMIGASARQAGEFISYTY